MAQLFEPFSLGPLTLSNRVVIAPMCQYSAIDGCATPWHAVHLGGLALGTPGLLIVEATAVVPEGRISPFCLGLWDGQTEAALGDVIRYVRATSPHTPLAIQLGHAGRKACVDAPWRGGKQIHPKKGGWRTVSASDIPFAPDDHPPHALTENEIKDVIRAFAEAAQRAVRLGFNAIEIHAAHGYLLHQFLSPLSNKRTDSYGGSLENRMRLTQEVYDAVRAVTPKHIAVGVRISATDWVESEESWDLEQSVVLSELLHKRCVDWIHVSSAGLASHQNITIGPGYQIPFSETIKKRTGATTISVGLITEAKQAENILQKGQADLVAIARAALFNPRWVWHAAAELGATLTPAPQYLRCEPADKRGIFKNP